MVERRFWKPSVTSQFKHCPIPFHLDTYKGCAYGCVYCFSRDITTFVRRNSEHKEFNYLIGNRADLLKKWIKRTIEKEYDYNKAHEVAFKERIPLKIGACTDPFPYIEKQEKITYEVLKVLHEYDYPCEIQTKNPEILLGYANEFVGANWTIAVTIVTYDEEFAKVIEPHAPSPQRRMKAIKGLIDLGFNVMIKVQPSIYPKVLEDLPVLIEEASKVGVWAFNIEGLKCRVAMSKEEQKMIQIIGDYLGMNIRDFYKEERKEDGTNGADYELSKAKKDEIYKLAKELADKYSLKFFIADNYINPKYSCSCECCGTEKLRDYKLLSCDSRSLILGNNKGSKELEKCKVNFVRINKYDGLTIKEACELENRKN